MHIPFICQSSLASLTYPTRPIPSPPHQTTFSTKTKSRQNKPPDPADVSMKIVPTSSLTRSFLHLPPPPPPLPPPPLLFLSHHHPHHHPPPPPGSHHFHPTHTHTHTQQPGADDSERGGAGRRAHPLPAFGRLDVEELHSQGANVKRRQEGGTKALLFVKAGGGRKERWVLVCEYDDMRAYISD
jgi:hypothetical protein